METAMANQKRLKLSQKRLDNFWKRVDRRDSKLVCWEWTGQITGDGRPKLGATWATHIMWQIWRGKAPTKGRVIYRACGNIRCVNPQHLSQGTRKHAVKQMAKHQKGRSQPGADHPQAKLTEEQVKKIRWLWSFDKEVRLTQKQLAESFDISQSHVSRIIRGKGWKEV